MLLLGIVSFLLWESSHGAPLVIGTANSTVRDHFSLNNNTLFQLTWEDAVAKGSQLWTALQSGCYPDKANPPSILQLKNDNWVVDPWPPARIRYEDVHPVLPSEPMETIGVLRGPFYFEETISRSSSNLLEARFLATYSPLSGSIVAQNSRRESHIPIFWSDATFAMWQTVNARYSTSPSGLRYILRANVNNPDTTYIIEQIQGQAPEGHLPLDIFPTGTSFDWFLALLGTPNGAGSLYLLLDHKRALGFKTIKKISLFAAGPGLAGHMLFEVEDFKPNQALGIQNVQLSNQSWSNTVTSGNGHLELCSSKSPMKYAPEASSYETS